MMPVDGGCISESQTHVFILPLPNDCMRQSHYLIKGDISGSEVVTVFAVQIRQFGCLGCMHFQRLSWSEASLMNLCNWFGKKRILYLHLISPYVTTQSFLHKNTA